MNIHKEPKSKICVRCKNLWTSPEEKMKFCPYCGAELEEEE